MKPSKRILAVLAVAYAASVPVYADECVLPPAPSKVPDGHDHWTVRMLAGKAVELGYVRRISPETVRHRIEEWLEQTAADEMITVAQIYDHAARLRSYEIGSRVFQQINAT